MKFKRMFEYDNTCADTFETIKDRSSLTVQEDYVPFEQLIRYYNVRLPDGVVYDDADDDLDDTAEDVTYDEYLDDKTTYDNYVKEVKDAVGKNTTVKVSGESTVADFGQSDNGKAQDASTDKGDNA